MCEVNCSLQKKNSKYILKNNEQDTKLFIFEIILKSINGKTTTIRRMKKDSQGNLLSSEDSIDYDNIGTIKINILNYNNLKNEISVKIILDNNSTYTTYLNNQIYLEFNKNSDGCLECNYNVINFI
jgi:hypothetical protein